MPTFTTFEMAWTPSDWWGLVIDRILLKANGTLNPTNTFVSALAVPYEDRFAVQLTTVSDTGSGPTVVEHYIVWQSIREGSKLPFSFLVSQAGFLAGQQWRDVVSWSFESTGQAYAAQMLAEAAGKMEDCLTNVLALLCDLDTVTVESEPLIEDEPNRYSSKTVVLKATEFGIRHVIGLPLVVKFRENGDPDPAGYFFQNTAHISERASVQLLNLSGLAQAVRDVARRDISVTISPESIRVNEFPPEE